MRTAIGVTAAVVLAALGCSDAGAKPPIPADRLGTFTCADLKQDVCLDPTEVFPVSAPILYVTFKTKTLPKNGDVYTIKWIAEDVGAAAPANTVIRTVTKSVEDAQLGMKNYVVNSSLTRPTNGWPVGKYRVEISHGEKLATTARFTIK